MSRDLKEIHGDPEDEIEEIDKAFFEAASDFWEKSDLDFVMDEQRSLDTEVIRELNSFNGGV